VTSTGLAFASAALLALGLGELAEAGIVGAIARGPRLARTAAALADAVVRAGSEGRDPGADDRRRLLACGAVLAFAAGALAAGPVVGLAVGAGGPWVVARTLRARRERYRRMVEAGASDLCLALADALRAGQSLRAALAGAAQGMTGAAAHELRRVAAELHAGGRTEDALEAMRARAGSARIDTVVAACLVQRRAGGDLARLLRECAETFGDQARLEDDVRAATAQARFTGVVVVLLPVCGALLAELASPGFVAGLWSSFVTAWLVGIALVLQAVAALLIHRLGQVRW
jgi:tight adherence protein B